MQKLPKNKNFSIHEAALYLKVSTKTLRRWEAGGLISSFRTDGGHRRYNASDLQQIALVKENKPKKSFVKKTTYNTIDPKEVEAPEVITTKYEEKYEPIEFNHSQHRTLKLIALSFVFFLMAVGLSKTNSPISNTINEYKSIILPNLLSMNSLTKIPGSDIVRTLANSYQGSTNEALATINSIKGRKGAVLAAVASDVPVFNVNIASSFNDVADFVQGLTALDVATGTLEATGAAKFGSTVNITGATTIAGPLRETGLATFTRNVDIAGDLTSPSTTFNLLNTTVTTLNIGSAANTISIAAGSGTTTINNDLSVKGKSTIAGTETVSGAASFGSSVSISGNLSKISGVDYTFPTAQGAASTVLKNDGAGTLTWGTVQAGTTGTGTAGQVTFWAGATALDGSDTFFWDDTNSRLGIGNNTPTTALDVTGAGTFSSSLTSIGVNSGIGLIQGTGGITVSGAANINSTGVANTSIGNGSGAVSLTLGSDVVGDIFYRNVSGNLARLGVGTTNQVLTVSGGGLPSWAGGSSGSVGFWTRTGTTLTPTTSGDAVTINGLVTASLGLTVTGGTANINSSGTNNTSIGNGTGTVTLTLGSDATGDVFYRNSAGNIAKLGIGSTGQALTVTAGGLPGWAGGTGGTGDSGFWNRSGTTLTPTNTGDNITTAGNISTTGSGTLSSAGLLTASNGFTMSTGALSMTSSSGAAALTLSSSTTAFNVNSGVFDIDTTNSRVGVGTAAPAAMFSVGSTSQFQVSSAGAVTAVGLNSGAGLIQGTGGLTVSGATNINTTGVANTSIGNGTGTVSLTLGSDATGDVFYRNVSGNLARLAVGSTGQTLTVTAGLPSWVGGAGTGASGYWTRTGTTLSTSNAGDNMNLGTGQILGNRTTPTSNFFAGLSGGNATTTGVDNVAIGNSAGVALTTGTDNVMMGYQAGMAATTDTANVFVGSQAGLSQVGGTFGGRNIDIGFQAGRACTTCWENTIMGYQAGVASTSDGNVLIGYSAGGTQTSGAGNTYVGTTAGSGATGSSNTFVGSAAGASVTGDSNVMIGYTAGQNVNAALSYSVFIGQNAGTRTTGAQNTYVGYQSGSGFAAGARNTLLGYNTGSSLFSDYSGVDNVFIGNVAGTNASGSRNTLLGSLAGSAANTASDNTFLGYNAGVANTSAAQSVLIGSGAGSTLTTTGTQTFIGYLAGTANTSGGSNTFIGYQAGKANTTSGQNTYIGNNAGLGANGGANNVVIGDNAGGSLTSGSNTIVGSLAANSLTGSSTVMVGTQAGNALTTQVANVFVGRAAGFNATGSSDTILGSDTNSGSGGSNTVVGYAALVSGAGDSNVVIGRNSNAGASSRSVFVGSTAGQNLSGSGASYSVFVGFGSGSNVTGAQNSFVGYDSGKLVTSGTNNTFLGYQTGHTLTTASNNTFLGNQAGEQATGASNTFLGSLAGSAASNSGADNVFLGYNAGVANTSAGTSVLIGSSAGAALTTTGSQTFIGYQAGTANTSGAGNTLIGYQSGKTITSNGGNTYVGYQTGLAASNSGTNNSLLGYQAGTALTSGSDNVFLGYQAGKAVTTSGTNVFVGSAAGAAVTVLNANGGQTFLGYQSGTAVTSGERNTLLGYQTGRALTTQSQNVFIGWGAGISSTSGASTIIGQRAGDTTTGDNNVLIGVDTGHGTGFSGANNVFVGNGGGQSASSAAQDTLIGHNAGGSITTGQEDTLIGYTAGGSITTGGSNTLIGSRTGGSLVSGTGNVFLGYNAGGTETGSNKLYIDNTNTTTPLIYGDFSTAQAAIGTGTLQAKFTIAQTDAANDEVLYLNTEESTATQTVFALESDSTGNSQSADTVKAHFIADGSLFVSLAGTQTTNGLCHAGTAQDNDDKIVDCSGAPSDYAEWYVTKTDTMAGDIIALGEGSFTYDSQGADPHTGQVRSLGLQEISIGEKATNGEKILGVYSTAPYATIGEDVKKGVQEYGDGSVKAVPIALNGRVPVNIDPNSPSIKAGDFLTTSHDLPGKGTKATTAGYVIGKALESWNPGSAKTTVLVFVSSSYFFGDMTASGQIMSPSTTTSTNVVGNASTDVPQATDSGTVDNNNVSVSSIEDLLAQLNGVQSMIQNAQNWNTNTATDSADLSGRNLYITDQAAINSLTVTGTASFTTINSLTEPLKIQSLALVPVEIMGGRIKIDTEGNITIDGNITAKAGRFDSVTTNKITLGNINTATDSAVLGIDAVSGSGTISAGQTVLIINTSEVTDKSLVLVTPKTITDKVLAVTEKVSRTSFKVEISSAETKDINFDWWIVGKN